MTGGVFLKRGDGLLEMLEEPYELEGHLQELIERHPNLLAGDQVDPDAPRRWLLLSREAGLASEEDGRERWSVDHLLLDQDAIPTIVEVKRSSNTEIRRRVVGQMLDYAANAVTYWNLDRLRVVYEEAARALGREPEQEITDLVGEPEVDVDEFWERAKTNLRAGRIRLVFVADAIPTELQRIVEFLNERMSPTEVLAIEIRQYTGGGEQMLVPRVFGQTAGARQKKAHSGSRGSRQWDEQSFLAECELLAGREEAAVALKIMDWSRTRFSHVHWGRGETTGGFVPVLDHGGIGHRLFLLRTDGAIWIMFAWMRTRPPFDVDSKRLELLRKLNEIPAIELPESALLGKPAIPLSTFATPGSLGMLFEVCDWFIAEVSG